MESLTRKSLERLRDRFAKAEDDNKVLGSLLIEHISTGRNETDDSAPPISFEGRRKAGGRYAITYRNFAIPKGQNDAIYFTDRPTLNPHGKPIANSAGEPIACILGATRSLEYFGESDAKKLYERLADEAGRCCEGLPNHLMRLFSMDTRQIGSPDVFWEFVVYELAWMQPKGSALPPAERMAWKDNATVPVSQLPRMQVDPFVKDTFLANWSYPPTRWYAEIGDLFSASRAAIDVILTTWDSVPDGWVGLSAPKDIQGLARYLDFAQQEIGTRVAAHPQFRDATDETRFNEAYPRAYWWPYLEFEQAQVKTMVIASDNAAVWLKLNFAGESFPTEIEFSDRLGIAMEKFKEWKEFVERRCKRMSIDELIRRMGSDPSAEFDEMPLEMGSEFEIEDEPEFEPEDDLYEPGTASTKSEIHQNTVALLSVFSNGVSDDRIRQAVNVLDDPLLSVNEKLTKIDALIPFPPTASAQTLAKMLGVKKQAVAQSPWWTQNRKGEKKSEIGRRRTRHQGQSKCWEEAREDDEE